MSQVGWGTCSLSVVSPLKSHFQIWSEQRADHDTMDLTAWKLRDSHFYYIVDKLSLTYLRLGLLRDEDSALWLCHCLGALDEDPVQHWDESFQGSRCHGCLLSRCWTCRWCSVVFSKTLELVNKLRLRAGTFFLLQLARDKCRCTIAEHNLLFDFTSQSSLAFSNYNRYFRWFCS